MKRLLLRVLGAAVAALVLVPASALAWAPASTATIHPGVQTVTSGGQCTSNFVFTQGGNVYLGQAAHCSSTGGQTSTDGCQTNSLPLGTKVDVQGASRQGTLVYNSWLAMHSAGETDSETCAYNDLALVQLDPADIAKVNPSIPNFGGPQGIGPSASGQQVYTYGNSSLRAGLAPLSPKNGVTVQVSPGGWHYDVYTVTPGIPGDSGSAFLNASGGAMGVLSTVAIAPLPLSNGVGDIGHEVAYAHGHGFAALVLENGTVPFSAKILGVL
jgi:hypothetical protein